LEQDPVWKLPCNDMHGARFWRNLRDASNTCTQSGIRFSTEVNRPVHEGCQRAVVEMMCPPLAATDWWERYRAARPWSPHAM
jgi:hypothetical protein